MKKNNTCETQRYLRNDHIMVVVTARIIAPARLAVFFLELKP
jgi:hypothetical protein